MTASVVCDHEPKEKQRCYYVSSGQFAAIVWCTECGAVRVAQYPSGQLGGWELPKRAAIQAIKVEAIPTRPVLEAHIDD